MPKRQGRYAVMLGDFWRSMKTDAVSNEALGVYAKSLSYCAENMTDGFVPDLTARRFCRGKSVSRIVKELTTPIETIPGKQPTPFWHRIEGGIRIHNYKERNLTRAEWEAQKKTDRERKQGVTPSFQGGSQPESDGTPGPIPAASLLKTQDSRLKNSKESGYTRARDSHISEIDVGPLRAAFARRYDTAMGGVIWSHARYDKELRNLTSWCAKQAEGEKRGTDAVILQLLNGFFADDWAGRASFVMSALAKDPGKYYKPGGTKAEPKSIIKRDADGKVIPTPNPYLSEPVGGNLLKGVE